MNANPHVDRVFLDERVSGTSRGGENPLLRTDFGLDLSVIDQCPANAVTDVDTGYVLKLEIDDLSNLQPVQSSDREGWYGFGIKAAAYYPKIGGAITAMSFWTGKFTGFDSISYDSRGRWVYYNVPFDFSVIKRDVFNHIVRGDYYISMPIVKGADAYFHDVHPDRYGMVWGTNVAITMVMWSNSPTTQLQLFRAQTTGYGTRINAKGTFSVGTGIMDTSWWHPASNVPSRPSAVGSNIIGAGSPGWYAVAGYSGMQGSGIPDRIKPLFPPSWHNS